MKLLIDMNLSPRWLKLLHDAAWEAEHWSHIGRPNAPDSEVMGHAAHGYVVVTHDLDFGAILAITRAEKPRRPDSKPRCYGRAAWPHGYRGVAASVCGA